MIGEQYRSCLVVHAGKGSVSKERVGGSHYVLYSVVRISHLLCCCTYHHFGVLRFLFFFLGNQHVEALTIIWTNYLFFNKQFYNTPQGKICESL